MIKKTNSCPACSGDGYIICTSCNTCPKLSPDSRAVYILSCEY